MNKLTPTPDARVWYLKWSTWLAGSAASAVSAYALLPQSIQDTMPRTLLLGLGLVAMFLVPVATSLNQRNLERKLEKAEAADAARKE